MLNLMNMENHPGLEEKMQDESLFIVIEIL